MKPWHSRKRLGWSSVFILVALAQPAVATAGPPKRDGWVVTAQDTRPALVLGPTRAFVPLPAGAPVSFDLSTRVLLCAELGCEIVVAREQADLMGPGLRLTTASAFSRAADVVDDQVPALIQASDRLWDLQATTPPLVHFEEPQLDAHLEPDNDGARPKRKRKSRPRREKNVLWSDPGPWTGELGALGGVGVRLVDGYPVGGLASVRVGFRYLRFPKRARSLGGNMLAGIGTMVVGTHFGADLQADVVATAGRPVAWSLMVQPSLAAAFPQERTRVGFRLPALLGLFAIGVGGVGNRVGFAVQINPRISLLVTRRFGVDLRCSLDINLATGTWSGCAVGGFVR